MISHSFLVMREQTSGLYDTSFSSLSKVSSMIVFTFPSWNLSVGSRRYVFWGVWFLKASEYGVTVDTVDRRGELLLSTGNGTRLRVSDGATGSSTCVTWKSPLSAFRRRCTTRLVDKALNFKAAERARTTWWILFPPRLGYFFDMMVKPDSAEETFSFVNKIFFFTQFAFFILLSESSRFAIWIL